MPGSRRGRVAASLFDASRGGLKVPHQFRIDDSHHIAEIVISAPNRNALDKAGILELHALFDRVVEDDEVRAVIVSGADGNFCAGRVRNMNLVTKDEISTDLEPILALNARVESCPVPIIAAVEGVALGFGFGMATFSDVTIAAEGATFALTELAHGIPPLIVLSYFFRFVPYKVGLDLALTGREVTAEGALRLGIATTVCAKGSALKTAREIATTIAGADPEAVRILRRFARDQASLADPAAAARGADRVAALLAQGAK